MQTGWSYPDLADSQWFDVLGTCKPPFEADGRVILDGGVAAMGIVPALNECKDSSPRLRVGMEDTLVKQFTLKRGEEALTQGIIVATAGGPHGRPDTCFLAPLPKSEGGILRPLVGVMDNALRSP